MAQIYCEDVAPGMRKSEAVVTIQDFRGRKHFLRVERDFLTDVGGLHYLPTGLVHFDPKSGAALVELPHEAETGANRIWVKIEKILNGVEAHT